MLIDSHCHLNYPELADTTGVVARAVESGVMQANSSKCKGFTEVKSMVLGYRPKQAPRR